MAFAFAIQLGQKQVKKASVPSGSGPEEGEENLAPSMITPLIPGVFANSLIFERLYSRTSFRVGQVEEVRERKDGVKRNHESHEALALHAVGKLTEDELAEWVWFLTADNRSASGIDVLVDNGELALNSTFVWPD